MRRGDNFSEVNKWQTTCELVMGENLKTGNMFRVWGASFWIIWTPSAHEFYLLTAKRERHVLPQDCQANTEKSILMIKLMWYYWQIKSWCTTKKKREYACTRVLSECKLDINTFLYLLLCTLNEVNAIFGAWTPFSPVWNGQNHDLNKEISAQRLSKELKSDWACLCQVVFSVLDGIKQ